MPENTRWRLSLMMFLEYVIYGAWLPLLGLYLGNADQRGGGTPLR